MILLAAVLGAMLPSCGTLRYYSQAVHGQMDILHRAKPNGELIDNPETKRDLRGQLKLVEAMRKFACEELKLPVKRQFGSYADLGRDFVVWNVYAAPEFSVEAKTWWYPFVGSAKYRGYFSLEAAKDEVKKLKAGGYDVSGSGIRVYSTLGWFADPVLNTFIKDSESDLAQTLFHELGHSRLFIAGDTDFNEAFATAVSQEGVRRWLRSRGRGTVLARYEKTLKQDRAVLTMLEGVRERLRKLYGDRSMPADVMRNGKARIMHEAAQAHARMKRTGEASDTYDKWFVHPLNNARLVMLATYHDLVPGFDRILHEEGGDLERFYGRVARMRHLSVTERRKQLGVGTGSGS